MTSLRQYGGNALFIEGFYLSVTYLDSVIDIMKCEWPYSISGGLTP